MNLMANFLSILSVVAVAGCDLRSQGDFDAQPFEMQQTVDAPYQEVYARFLGEARKCWRPGVVVGTPASIELETNIYSDLGYAEVYNYSTGLVFIPTALVRIERSGNASIVKIKTGPIAGKQIVAKRAMSWATGSGKCGVK